MENKNTELTQEQAIEIKTQFLNEISNKYANLIEAIKRLPLDERVDHFRIESISNINTGFLWVKEALAVTTLPIPRIVNPDSEKMN